MSSAEDPHIVKSYDAELAELRASIARMGELAGQQLHAALEAAAARDGDAAARVVASDSAVDALEQRIHDLGVRILLLRAPVAEDLRTVVTALRVAEELERIADLAANIAKRSRVLNQSPPVPLMLAVTAMGAVVVERVKGVLDAYLTHDAAAALTIWKSDLEIDDLHGALSRDILQTMMEDSQRIPACSQLMFVVKNLERCGDHATNIAEMTHYLAIGRHLREERPKGPIPG